MKKLVILLLSFMSLAYSQPQTPAQKKAQQAKQAALKKKIAAQKKAAAAKKKAAAQKPAAKPAAKPSRKAAVQKAAQRKKAQQKKAAAKPKPAQKPQPKPTSKQQQRVQAIKKRQQQKKAKAGKKPAVQPTIQPVVPKPVVQSPVAPALPSVTQQPGVPQAPALTPIPGFTQGPIKKAIPKPVFTQKTAQLNVTHGIFMFMDDTERKIMEAVTVGFVSALMQRAGPILFSGSLMQNIFTTPNLDAIDGGASQAEKLFYGHTKSFYETVKNKLQAIPAGVQPTYQLLTDINTGIVSANMPFFIELANFRLVAQLPGIKSSILKELFNFGLLDIKQDEWELFKVDPYLYLLIPKTYIQEMTQKYGGRYTASASYSVRELALGLKIDHLEKISEPWQQRFGANYQRPAQLFPATYLVPNLSNIFIERNDYTQLMKSAKAEATGVALEQLGFSTYDIETMPQWFIYLLGHGQLGVHIGGLTIDQFKQLLQFLEHKIVTKLFAYLSCFSSGTNAELAYKDAAKNLVQTYSFGIATSTLNDTVAAILGQYIFQVPLGTLSSYNIDFLKKTLAIYPPMSYGMYLKNITAPGDHGYTDHLDMLFPPAGEGFEGSTEIQFKAPGLEWFNADVFNTLQLARIGKVMAKTRKDPLDIVKFFGSDNVRAILLYAEYIPFTIIINTINMPRIISMVPGIGITILKKIESNTLTPQKIVDSFFAFKDSSMDKTFYIGEVNGKGESWLDVLVVIQNNAVIISYRKDSAYYETKDPGVSQAITDQETVNMLQGMYTKFKAIIVKLDEINKGFLQQSR